MIEKQETFLKSIEALIEPENSTGSLANIFALIFENVSSLNWAGYYFFDGKNLRLGQFQGKVACTKIPLNRGVCGKAATDQQTIVVEDVHLFEGHIACDSQSRSEIVVPLIVDEKLVGVLDIDSPILARFGAEEKKLFEQIADLIVPLVHRVHFRL